MISNNPVLVVRSVTNAIKGQKILESNGIDALVYRNTSPSSRQGCGYGLRLQGGSVQTAVNLLNNAGIKVVEIQGG